MSYRGKPKQPVFVSHRSWLQVGDIVRAEDAPFAVPQVQGRFGKVVDVQLDRNGAVVDFGPDYPHVLINIKKLSVHK